MRLCLVLLLAAAALVVAPAAPSRAQAGVKLLVPSEDTCAALLQAMKASDAAAMLSLGGWSLGFLSGIAQQSGKDILRDVTSQGLMDQLSAACQRAPEKPLSSIVEQIAAQLLAGVR